MNPAADIRHRPAISRPHNASHRQSARARMDAGEVDLLRVLLGLWQFPYIPGSAKFFPGSGQKIPGSVLTGIGA
jgi:hypothetical protein